jgi:hypothetical protein
MSPSVWVWTTRPDLVEQHAFRHAGQALNVAEIAGCGRKIRPYIRPNDAATTKLCRKCAETVRQDAESYYVNDVGTRDR